MEITGKKVLVLGGAGLVGRSVCRILVTEGVKELIVSSLFEWEAENFIKELKDEMNCEGIKFATAGGNLFVREEFKNLSRNQILENPEKRKIFIKDTIEPLDNSILQSSALYKLINQHKPDIIIDSINTATAVAYQDIFSATVDVANQLETFKIDQSNKDYFLDSVEKLLGTQYIPQLIRHVQIMLQGIKDAKSQMYIKVGTSGTGGMGLNIPYTHSEDKPSRVLLAKSAIAGAHTLLLFLMGRTPDAPIIKEVKPTAAIAWKRIAFGPVMVKGKEVVLEDCSLKNAFDLNGKLALKIQNSEKIISLKNGDKPKVLEAPFVDTGENGMFSLGEFEAITDAGQMEYITPEEIAQTIVWEIKGRNTGSDIVNALDNATMGPTYRAGYLRRRVLDKMRKLEKEHQIDSVAFEMLGPPRLSKLLYEIYLLKKCFGTFDSISQSSPDQLSDKITQFIDSNPELRSRIISIGIPILLKDGKSLLRGSVVKIPTHNENLEITAETIDDWAYDGWVDLRPESMSSWKKRIENIMNEINSIPEHDTSSRNTRNSDYWLSEDGGDEIHIGKVASWIFINEEKGERMKA